MAFFGLFNNKQTNIPSAPKEPLQSMFSTSYGNVGKGNLTLPVITSYNNDQFIRFPLGDNLYPQLINQMYKTSSMNGAIIDFKALSIIGGGFILESPDKSAKAKIDEYTFIKQNRFNKLMRQLTHDLVLHGRICVFVHNINGKIRLERVGPERIRNNAKFTMFTYSDDWFRNYNKKDYLPYRPGIEGTSLFYYTIDSVAGQDYYPLPAYTSALNACQVAGDIPFLYKQNMINSSFPSGMITVARTFQSQEEINEFKATVESGKGPQEAGRLIAFAGGNDSELPKFTEIPTSQNDKLFLDARLMIQDEICTAHMVAPIIMGIQTPGKLGSGNELEAAYASFEKTIVMSHRIMMEEVGDELLFIAGIPSTLKINDFKIVDGEVINKTKTLI
jgi:capsid portal protein